MAILLYQSDYHKATLAQFQAHLRNEIAWFPERVIKAASFCFEQWLKAREMNTKRLEANAELRASNERLRKAKPAHEETEKLYKKLAAATKEIKQLGKLRDELIEANKGLAEEVEELEAECSEWADSNKFFREDANAMALRSCDEYNKNERLRAENQRLKQQLAVRTVEVPQMPAGVLTIHPN